MKTQITKIMETETGHRLVAYDGKCAHVHGHRYRWEVTVTAHQLDDVGFVTDYSEVKQMMMKVIDPLDHAFIMSNEDPMVNMDLSATNGDPGRIFVVPFNPTSENLIDWVSEKLIEVMPLGLFLSHIKLWETSTSYAERKFVECM